VLFFSRCLVTLSSGPITRNDARVESGGPEEFGPVEVVKGSAEQDNLVIVRYLRWRHLAAAWTIGRCIN